MFWFGLKGIAMSGGTSSLRASTGSLIKWIYGVACGAIDEGLRFVPPLNVSSVWLNESLWVVERILSSGPFVCETAIHRLLVPPPGDLISVEGNCYEWWNELLARLPSDSFLLLIFLKLYSLQQKAHCADSGFKLMVCPSLELVHDKLGIDYWVLKLSIEYWVLRIWELSICVSEKSIVLFTE